jgi:hypothetical protein
MSNENKHPLITTYRNTGENPDYPVILCIGREPNDDKEVGTHLGDYDFEKFPRCAFWNTAYGSIARIAGINKDPCATLKNQCKDHNYNSPIAFADFSYRSVPFGTTDVVKFHKGLDKQKIKDHINALYFHPFFISKVNLVIFSGIDNCGFDPECVEYALNTIPNTKKSIMIPFFIGMQGPKIVDKLRSNQDIVNEINDIYHKWKNSI